MATRSFQSRSPRKPTGAFARHLVIMVKEPVAGRVKTRLARTKGVVLASAVYRQMVTSLVTRLGQDGCWQMTLAVSPKAALTSLMLPPHCGRIEQGAGNLGARMQSIFDRMRCGPVVIIGSDIPSITRADIAAAFRALGAHDVVIGPSGDGGYWLIGLKRRPRVLRPFPKVRWSSAHARADTEGNLSGCRIAYLSQRDDIDEAEDLSRQGTLVGRRIMPWQPAARPLSPPVAA